MADRVLSSYAAKDIVRLELWDSQLQYAGPSMWKVKTTTGLALATLPSSQVEITRYKVRKLGTLKGLAAPKDYDTIASILMPRWLYVKMPLAITKTKCKYEEKV